MPADRDELAKTATAASASGPESSTPSLGETLGRYRLERELGAGGMGVVHAAFDPDLERRVAVKVLRRGGSEEARKRLLREARAMARLSHPNVITVHEVASIGGRDYVAMELVDGESLAEWLRSMRRPQALIIEAFVAAGRGLAAAHAAGLVHRDFKPHNVLRARNGRIVVTDFGLAREAHDTADPLERTLPSDATVGGTDTPSTPLAGLTVTGSVLGTPAYMAPEQWSGGKVSAATDQFAFCVALWEAVTGERPFRGTTAEALRAEVTRGPASLDISKVPRHLRKTLLRGLDPDPAKRFPSMDALLKTMKRAERRPLVFLALGVVGMLTLASVFALVIRQKPVTVPPCPQPMVDPTTVWSPAIEQALLAKGRVLEARQLGTQVARWHAVRERTCGEDPAVGVVRRACLDRVLARIATVAQAVQQLGPGKATEPANFLVDPEVCEQPTPPRLVAPSPQLGEVVAAKLRDDATPGPAELAVLTDLVQRVASEPCAAAMARLDVAELTDVDGGREAELAAAAEAAERCGDDQVRAMVAMRAALSAVNTLAITTPAQLKLAEAAIARIPQPDVLAVFTLIDATHRARSGQLDDAIVRAERAAASLATLDRPTAEVFAAFTVMQLRYARGRADDIAKLPGELAALHARMKPILGDDHDALRVLHQLDIEMTWALGDVTGARAKRMALRRVMPNVPSRAVTGRVVDTSGAPVAGATVTVDRMIVGDSLDASIIGSSHARSAITAADGSFAIKDASATGLAIAQLADRRSAPVELAETMKLTLEPTSKVRGRVDLAGASAVTVIMGIQDPRLPISLNYQVIAPVQADGSFEIAGVPQGRMRVFAAFTHANSAQRAIKSLLVDVKQPVVEGVAFSLAMKTRKVHVIVRSTVGAPVANAIVTTIEGTVPSQMLETFAKRFELASDKLALPLDVANVPTSVKEATRRGDLYAAVDGPDGAVSACAIGLPGEISPETNRMFAKHATKIQVICTPVPPALDTVVVEVPPWPRLD